MSDDWPTRLGQPRIRHNEYTALDVPALGEWRPSLTVSVVVLAMDDQRKLDLVLASLAAQSYPGNLVDVVVVDCGGGSPLVLPVTTPERTRIVRCGPTGSGLGHPLHIGTTAADGDVILRLTIDILLDREHLEAHMRWHHRADYLVVTGSLTPSSLIDNDLGPSHLHERIVAGKAAELFETVLTEESNRSGEGYESAGGAISWPARLHRDIDGADPLVPSGEDLELSYRLAQAGAVFVPENEAHAWQTSRGPSDTPTYIDPFLRNRIPLRRDWRSTHGRRWKVPYLEVIVEVGDNSYVDIAATVTGALTSTVDDVDVLIVGPWGRLGPEPPSVDDDLFHLGLVRELFGYDHRVRLVETTPVTSAPAPFRFTCPAGLVPTPDALRRLTELADQDHLGMVMLAFVRAGELLIARLERTEAVARALILREPREDIGDVVHEIFGVHWIDGSEWALAAATAQSNEPASAATLLIEVDRWRKEARRRKDETEHWKREAERWKRAAQLRWRNRMMVGAARRIMRVPVARAVVHRVLRIPIVRRIAYRLVGRNG